MLKDLDYIRDGAAIYERSFAIIRAEADLSRFSAADADIVVRSAAARRSCAMPRWGRMALPARGCRPRTR